MTNEASWASTRCPYLSWAYQCPSRHGGVGGFESSRRKTRKQHTPRQPVREKSRGKQPDRKWNADRTTSSGRRGKRERNGEGKRRRRRKGRANARTKSGEEKGGGQR